MNSSFSNGAGEVIATESVFLDLCQEPTLISSVSGTHSNCSKIHHNCRHRIKSRTLLLYKSIATLPVSALLPCVLVQCPASNPYPCACHFREACASPVGESFLTVSGTVCFSVTKRLTRFVTSSHVLSAFRLGSARSLDTHGNPYSTFAEQLKSTEFGLNIFKSVADFEGEDRFHNFHRAQSRCASVAQAKLTPHFQAVVTIGASQSHTCGSTAATDRHLGQKCRKM